MTGDHASSLGLHPAVYFYSGNGRHQPTAVLAMTQFIKEIIERDEIDIFCKNRKSFEDFIVGHKIFVNQLTVIHGSMAKGYRQIKEYLRVVFDLVKNGKKMDEIELALSQHEKFQKLVNERPQLSAKSKPFTTNAKQQKFLHDEMGLVKVCGICEARIDNKSMHLDHIVDKSKGGAASTDNSQWAHPYCDSTYKYRIPNLVI